MAEEFEERKKVILTEVDTYKDVPEFKEECEKRGKMHEILSFEITEDHYILFTRSINHEDPAFAADDPSLTRDEYFTAAQAYMWFKDVHKNYPPLYNAFNRYFLAHYKAEDLLKYLESQFENKN